MAQVALAWVVDRPRVTSVILGARTIEQLEDNLGAGGLHLTRGDGAAGRGERPGAGDYPYGGPGWSSGRERCTAGDPRGGSGNTVARKETAVLG